MMKRALQHTAAALRPHGRLALGLALAAALAACSTGTPRPKPAELGANPALVGVGQAWAVQMPAVDFPLQVNVQGNQVHLAAGNGTVLTLDAASGRELARASLNEPLNAGVGSDGTISAVVTRANQVVALQGAQELWRRRLPTQSYTAPLVAGGRVFVLGADRTLMAMDGRSGELLWQVQREAEPLVLRQAGLLLPVGNTLVAGLAGRMVGVNPDSGSILWEAPLASARGTNDLERLIDLVGGVHRSGDTVCARAFQTAVGCVNAGSGQVLWSRPANGATGVAGDENLVFGAEANGTLTAWRAATGERAWSSDGLKWRYLTTPLVLGRSVVVGDEQGYVHLLAREDGQPLDRVRAGSAPIAATPVAAGGTLVVVTRTGGVYGFTPQ